LDIRFENQKEFKELGKFMVKDLEQ